MHQMGANSHPTSGRAGFFLRSEGSVTPLREIGRGRGIGIGLVHGFMVLGLLVGASTAYAQSGNSQSQPPANSQSQDENLPDAPSAVQLPPPKALPPSAIPDNPSAAPPGEQAPAAAPQENPTPPKMPPVRTIAPGSAPRNQINASDDLYTISVKASFVQIPVMVKDKDGRRVDGLLPKDFVVLENGKPQKLTYFTSDPFQLSVAIMLDLGMADVALQKVNQTYASLVGAFSPYDEYALYTYSSTVSQVTDFGSKPQVLTAALDSLKLVRGRSGPPVLGGPLGPQPPQISGIPVGSSGPPPVITAPREAHALNDALLRAAEDLSHRDRTRRKVILVISDGRELGSTASYRDVLHVLQTRDIQVKGIVVDSGALPVYKQVERIHLKGQGYGDILPKYANATGGGQVYAELSRNSIEEAYNDITSEARNQYTLGYSPQAIKGSNAYRSIEVLVDKKDLNIYTKQGYYPVPTAPATPQRQP